MVAIATGIAQGLGVGTTRGAAVVSPRPGEKPRSPRLGGVAMGGEAVTFSIRLAGMGDLIATFA